MFAQSMRVVVTIVATAAAVVLAETPNAVKPALDGNCPVAYAAMGKAVKGDPAVSSEVGGRTYLFSNAAAKKMFDAAPEKYLPAYDGLCATAVSQGMKVPADPKQFSVKDGRTFLFSNAQAKAMFDKDAGAGIAKADLAWAKLAKGTK